MDAVLGIAVGMSTARIALIEGAKAEGNVIDEAVLEIPAPRRPDGGAAEVIDTIVGTQRSLANAGHRLVAAGVCALGGFASVALREAMQHHGVEGVVLISEAEADEALSNRDALNDPQREVATARGAALAAPKAMNAGPPTIFRSALVRPIGPTHVGAGARADTAHTQLGPIAQADMAPTQFGPIANPPTGPFAASTQLAPTAPPPPALAAPLLAYSMTGSVGALTDYVEEVEEYESGRLDYSEAQGPDDIDPDASDPDLDDAPEQAPVRPAKKSFLLVGSLAAVFTAIAISILTTTVVMSVAPTADQKRVTSSQQPVLAPRAIQVSEPPVVVPAPPPAQPPPAPAVIAPVPKAPVTQAPPRVTQAPPRAEPRFPPVISPPPDEGDGPPPDDDGSSPDEGDGPPPRSRHTPSLPPDDDGDGPPPRSRFTPGGPLRDDGGVRRGGFLGLPGCIPLLPC